MTRTGAFLTHLAASLAVVAAALALFVWLWYPMPYFTADGGWRGLRLVAGVDLVLGPLLTLVVFRPSKSRRALAVDYAVILGLQLMALAAGLWVAYTQRTVLVAYAEGAFYTVDADSLVLAGDEGRSLVARSGSRPAHAIVRLPEDPDERQEVRKESLRSGRPLFLFGHLYEPVTPAALERIASASVGGAAPEGPELGAAADALRSRAGDSGGGLLFFRAVCRISDLLLAFRADTGELVGSLPYPGKAPP